MLKPMPALNFIGKSFPPADLQIRGAWLDLVSCKPLVKF
jgi:hypothetical protein